MLRFAKEEAEHKTSRLEETIKRLRAEATAGERVFHQSKVDAEGWHKKELAQLTANLEATTTKAEQANAELKRTKRDLQKALGKSNNNLAKKTAYLAEKERELSIATAALTTNSSDLESTREALAKAKEDHINCAETIKSLETSLRDSEAINNASRTNARMEEDRVTKGIEKATMALEERLNEMVHNNKGLEEKCNMLQDRVWNQEITGRARQHQLLQTIVEEHRHRDRAVEYQRLFDLEQARTFELDMEIHDLHHKFGLDKE
ncbi:hypothetical protein OCU04_004011 [Sclerotinia nivalis]|uniref:Uncharacterized protein n=1 Tax=Sclerotinia nivalis TaxID=352851 RepID=A0A9X0AT29_9HELO|nr:hypothetical protein OCU04_004011 [Sclerotinia nivalis]